MLYLLDWWITFLALFCGMAGLIWATYVSYGHTTEFNGYKAALILTAHPDDECMFFGPVICHLAQLGVKVRVLCLSIGNWYGIGQTRVEEFYHSCGALGVPSDQCHIVDDPKLQDDPSLTWNHSHVINVVKTYLAEHNVDAIITFDGYGVSGHHNHISLYHAVKGMSVPGVTKYRLTSVNMLRKYFSVLDLLTAASFNECGVVLSLANWYKPYKAMFEHRSQLMWFRYLYIMFSRYMFFNTVEVIE